jgi:hypothetical protein
MWERPRRIVSGGQTGVDRAALDVALELGLDCSGWCPRGRRAEDGRIDDRYPLRETPTRDYRQRTVWNVRDSDATLVLCIGAPDRGTRLTLQLAERASRPRLQVDLAEAPDLESLRSWIAGVPARTLNVAGPRESRRPGIHALARALLLRLLGGAA